MPSFRTFGGKTHPMIHVLNSTPSVFNTFLREIRDHEIQQDRLRFRKNLERIGQIMAFEVSKSFPYSKEEIITPLGEAEEMVMDEQPVLISILRAGLPFHNGFLEMFDHAENGFVSAYRRAYKGGDFEIEVEYVSCPSIEGKTVIICDPMIATGSSVECVYKALRSKGEPKHIHVASAIASKQGLDHVQSSLPSNLTIWVGAVDLELTAQSYIVPGLGDAGDLAFGEKST